MINLIPAPPSLIYNTMGAPCSGEYHVILILVESTLAVRFSERCTYAIVKPTLGVVISHA
jgi:hypothetical protein